MSILFIFCIFLIIYPYALYPCVLMVLRLLAPRRIEKHPINPRVSILISAYNEEAVIEGKIKNALALDYPGDKLEIIVISDCSSDSTDDIVRRYAPQGVQLYRQEERLGKTMGLNAVMPAVTGDIVFFTDADAIFDKQAIKEMLAFFSDPSVGLVTGSTRYMALQEGRLVATSSLYTKLERFLKKLESGIHSCVGADGAIFAIRRTLYRPLARDDINDFMIPLNVVQSGYRVVFAPHAYCTETASENTAKEYRRQSRITNRTLRALFRKRALFNPRRYPMFCFFLTSHKLIRFLVPVFMIGALVTNLFLLGHGAPYVVFFLLQLLFYGIAVTAHRKERVGAEAGLFGYCYHFTMMNAAMLLGWFKFLTNQKDVTWDPQNT